MSALSSALPRTRPRTITSAASTPNAVFSGTATATMSSVSLIALIALSAVSASHTAPRPLSNVL